VGGGLIGSVLGGILGLMIGILVNDVAEPGLSATPHVSPVLLMVAGGLIGVIAIGIIASFTGANVADAERNEVSHESYAVMMTGTEDEFIEATRIIRGADEH
jgi:hypothetical protein